MQFPLWVPTATYISESWKIRSRRTMTVVGCCILIVTSLKQKFPAVLARTTRHRWWTHLQFLPIYGTSSIFGSHQLQLFILGGSGVSEACSWFQMLQLFSGDQECKGHERCADHKGGHACPNFPKFRHDVRGASIGCGDRAFNLLLPVRMARCIDGLVGNF